MSCQLAALARDHGVEASRREALPSLPMEASQSGRERDLPGFDVLGYDLLRISGWQRLQSLIRPLICVTLYFLFALRGWWIPALGALAGLMFITYVSTSHDLVHRTLGWSRPANEILLAVIELLVLRSGHAFRITHLHHHRRFPASDDVEGAAAQMPLWRALIEGIGQQPRLFFWAWNRARSYERRWLLFEAIGCTGLTAGSCLALRWSVVPFVYVAVVIISSWLYPVATVWIPHNREGKDAFGQTHAVRGRFVPALLLQHTYHLEHHLYPSVPSFNWQELSQRLDPYLREKEIRWIEVP